MAKQTVLKVTVVLLVATCGWLYWNLKVERMKNRVLDADQPFVELASVHAQGGPQASKTEDYFWPRVMRFPNEVCVQWVVKLRIAGEGGIYCYDYRTRGPTRAFP